MTNLLKAIINIVDNPIYQLSEIYSGSNRINNKGEALEFYIKDIFCNTLLREPNIKTEAYSKNFSYLGNKNNPPDFVIKGGDAIEIKKIENSSSALALNSSYPKDKLYADDPRIIKACRDCEEDLWIKKDILYVVGSVDKLSGKIKYLSMVYGDCYCADREIYQRISNKISEGINEISDIELCKTNEIAKVKRIDPLGITDLRVRGMWHIENPLNVFKDIFKVDVNKEFNLNVLMFEKKYNDFPYLDRVELEKVIKLSDVKIKSPNNPAQLLNAKLISYAQ